MAPVPDGNREGPNRNESEISDLDTPPVNLEVESESSSDDDTSAYSGYQLLSQDPETTGSIVQHEIAKITPMVALIHEDALYCLGNSGSGNH